LFDNPREVVKPHEVIRIEGPEALGVEPTECAARFSHSYHVTSGTWIETATTALSSSPTDLGQILAHIGVHE
jgi:hypothetical protein